MIEGMQEYKDAMGKALELGREVAKQLVGRKVRYRVESRFEPDTVEVHEGVVQVAFDGLGHGKQPFHGIVLQIPMEEVLPLPPGSAPIRLFHLIRLVDVIEVLP